MEIIGALAIMPAFGQRRCAMATFAARDITTTTSACGRISESGERSRAISRTRASGRMDWERLIRGRWSFGCVCGSEGMALSTCANAFVHTIGDPAHSTRRGSWSAVSHAGWLTHFHVAQLY